MQSQMCVNTALSNAIFFIAIYEKMMDVGKTVYASRIYTASSLTGMNDISVI